MALGNIFSLYDPAGKVLHHREHRGHWETQRTRSLTGDMTGDIRAVTGGDARGSTDAGVRAEQDDRLGVDVRSMPIGVEKEGLSQRAGRGDQYRLDLPAVKNV